MASADGTVRGGFERRQGLRGNQHAGVGGRTEPPSFFFPMPLKEEWVARSGARMVVVPDSGHLTPIDQPERFNEVLREFLAAQDFESKPPSES